MADVRRGWETMGIGGRGDADKQKATVLQQSRKRASHLRLLSSTVGTFILLRLLL
jgi:hypothetical protein